MNVIGIECFDKILIANRGEIACRIIRTAKKLGIQTVAIFSEIDRHALHVELADEAYEIGPAISLESYLHIDKIIEIAKRSGAQAVHPGYGFLSEKADFAKALEENNLVFIGPPVQAIRDMGSKSASKEIMLHADVAVIPGYHGSNQDDAFLEKQAKEIGFPVLIKAVSGGGGKGMRIVESEADFLDALHSARSESQSSFNDSRVLIEKYISKPRHIEVQIFGDSLGNVVTLFERDCSIQRRHQKIIEEAPAPFLSESLKKKLNKMAVNAAKAVGYQGAGTVEFIFDTETRDIYFMEMNTRLQVEHPITEFITGVDLVEWQLLVAAGNPIPLKQSEIHCLGHSIEARIYAENPENQFLPDTGKLIYLQNPDEGKYKNIRVETGVKQGGTVSIYYDPMIAKLSCFSNHRNEAIVNLIEALNDYKIVGLHTNIDFLKRILNHVNFFKGQLETGFIQKNYQDLFETKDVLFGEYYEKAMLQLCSYLFFSPLYDFNAIQKPLFGYRGAYDHYTETFEIKSKTQSYSIQCSLESLQKRILSIKMGKDHEACSLELSDLSLNANNCPSAVEITSIYQKERIRSIIVNHQNSPDTSFTKYTVLLKHFPGFEFEVTRQACQYYPFFLKEADQNLSLQDEKIIAIKSPMPSKVSSVLVQQGQEVDKGQSLLILEAMKMEHIIKSPIKGKVIKVSSLLKNGAMIEEQKVLIQIEPL